MATAILILKNGKTGSKMSFDNEKLIRIDGCTIGEYKSADLSLIKEIGKSGFVLKKDQIKSKNYKMVFGDDHKFKILKYCGPVGIVCAIGTYIPTKFNKELRAKFFNGTKF